MHFVHLALFLTTVLFIALTVILIVVATKGCSRWKQTEAMTMHESFEVYQAALEARSKLPLWRRYLDPRVHLEVRRKGIDFRYHSIRSTFLAQNELAPTFPFYVYLRKAMRTLLVKLIDIDWVTRVVLIVMLVRTPYPAALRPWRSSASLPFLRLR